MPEDILSNDVQAGPECAEPAHVPAWRDRAAKPSRAKRHKRSFAQGVACYAATGNASAMFDDEN